MRYNLPREFYIPKSAVVVQDKKSSAVAYLFTNGQGRLCAAAFGGKRAKPDWRYSFRDDVKRETAVREYFAAIQSREGRRHADRKDRAAWRHDFKVGDVFGTCWGYDQTNREYFECIEVKGKHLILREIGQSQKATGHDSWQTVPDVGRYVGDPIRRLAQKGGVRIDHVRWASYREPAIKTGGMRVFAAESASNGH